MCDNLDHVIDDMVLTEEQYNDYISGEQKMHFGRYGAQYLWSNGEMPVMFDDTIPKGSDERNFVVTTMTGMNKNLCGCFRFR